LEKENQRLSAALADIRRKRLYFAYPEFFARKISSIPYCLVFEVTRGRYSRRYQQVLVEGPG
jgi:hypothetical protein